MKLRNKKTGEIEEFEDITRVYKFIGKQNTYTSLAELNREWEDYEGLKEYWYINSDGNVRNSIITGVFDNPAKAIGNYFENEEEAEKAVEKLKAWKRLKDKGFRFCDWGVRKGQNLIIEASYSESGITEDMNIIFGGE